MSKINLKNIPWQSHSYRFPKKGFSVAILVEYAESDIPFYPLPFSKLHKEADDLAQYIKEAKIAVKLLSKERDMEARNEALVTSLELSKLIPLKREYWNKPSISYSIENRLEVFIKCWKNLEDYLILVVPAGKEQGKVQLNVVSAFRKKYLMQELVPFMQMSDVLVDPRATHAALYTPVKLRGYDATEKKWNTFSNLIN